MDSRDFRKTWLKLQESWKAEDADVNVNATKAEKLQEKRKLPDALKAHQFKKKDAGEPEKGETKKHEAGETPEQEKKEHAKGKKEEKKDDKKPSFLNKKKATEGKKVVKPVKKMKEDGAAAAGNAAAAGASNGSTTSTSVGGKAGMCPDAKVGGVAPAERLKKSHQKESKLFGHFKKYMAEAGLPLGPEKLPGQDVPGDVSGDAVAELTGEEPPVDASLEAPVDDLANVLADIQARFPGKKIHISVEADPTEPFSAEDVAAAQNAIETVPEDAEGLEGDEGAEDLLPPEEGLGDDGTEQGLKDESWNESLSMREDEEEDMGANDGVEEIPTGDEIGGDEAGIEGEDDLGGVEATSEASPQLIALTPEQWEEFLAAGEGEDDGLGDELAGATDVADAGEGEDSDDESNKSEDTIG